MKLQHASRYGRKLSCISATNEEIAINHITSGATLKFLKVIKFQNTFNKTQTLKHARKLRNDMSTLVASDTLVNFILMNLYTSERHSILFPFTLFLHKVHEHT